MPSLIVLALIAIVLYLLTFPTYLLRNLYYARRTGLPYVVIPLDQNSPVWMLTGVPLRAWLNRTLPQWLRRRIAITIYGWEYHEGSDPFERWAVPGGDAKTLAFVTCGQFEVNSMDPEFAIEVLRRPKDFPEPSFNELFAGRFGHNILTSNGEQWARQRRIIAPVINEKISKAVFSETVEQTRGMLADMLQDGSTTSADTYEAFDMMKRITIHVLLGAGMGQKVSWSDKDEAPKDGFSLGFMKAAVVIANSFAGPIILPSFFLDNYPSWLPGHVFLRELGMACHEYPIHTKAILRDERKRQTETGEVKSNIISQLIQAAGGDKTGITLSEDEMVGNMFIFTAAGYDTTANTLCFALAALSKSPAWQTWLFEEIDKIMPSDLDEIDYQTVFPKATRIMAVMLETLRMYTPLVHIPKSTATEQIVRTSSHTYRLPPKTTIYVNTCGLHRDPVVWRDLNQTASDPINESDQGLNDELVWRPSRWIVRKADGEALFQPPRGAFMPWSFGPRNCPGTKMSQVEFTAAFLTLLKEHKIEAVPLQVPVQGEAGLGMREETVREVSERIAARIQDSMSIVTLQMNDVYDAVNGKGLKLRISQR